MKSTGRFCSIEATKQEQIDQDMEDAIKVNLNFLKDSQKALANILPERNLNEVSKAMINYLVENL